MNTDLLRITSFQQVKDILTLQNTDGPFKQADDDLNFAIHIFTNIIFQKIAEESNQKELSQKKWIKKVKKHTESYKHAFIRICHSQIPFSLFDEEKMEKAIKANFENYTPFLFSYISSLNVKDLSESELEKIQLGLQQIDLRTLFDTINELDRSNEEINSSLLFLIQLVLNEKLNIPLNCIHNETTKEILSNFVRAIDLEKMNNPKLFIHMFWNIFSYSNLPFGYKHLESDAWLKFVNFSIQYIANAPLNDWPDKASIISQILFVIKDGKHEILNLLIKSNDHSTSILGHHLMQVFSLDSFNECIPHFHALNKVQPRLGFGVSFKLKHPFIEFSDKRYVSRGADPSFFTHLLFNVKTHFFTHNQLMIGLYKMSSWDSPLYLLAFNSTTEEMVWGLALEPICKEICSQNIEKIKKEQGYPLIKYGLAKIEDRIAVYFTGENQARFIDTATGEFCPNEELVFENVISDGINIPYITPDFFLFQEIYKDRKRFLLGKNCSSKNPLFEKEIPFGESQFLSTHFGILKSKSLTLISPLGIQITIDNCKVVKAKKDLIYIVGSNPENQNQSILSIRALKIDNEVISEVMQSIVIDCKIKYFGDICDDGCIVLISDKTIVFVDPKQQTVFYQKAPFHNFEYIIDVKSNVVWIWKTSLGECEIWKMTLETIVQMGTIKSNDLQILHATKNRLYFKENF